MESKTVTKMTNEERKLLEEIKSECRKVIYNEEDAGINFQKHLLLYRLIHGIPLEEAIKINDDEWFCPLCGNCRYFAPYICDEHCQYSPKNNK